MLKRNPNAADSLALVAADQAITVAQTAYRLAQVERTCGRDGCLPGHCRVRDSLRRSLAAERGYLAELQGQRPRRRLEIAS
jgi:hypothetical protein